MRTWLTDTIHSSWRITAGALGLLIGVAAAPRLPLICASVSWLLAGLVLIGLALARSYRWLCVTALVGGLLCGAWRGTSELRALTAYRPYYDTIVQVSGVLRDDASYGAHGDLRFELQTVHINNGPAVAGRIWVSSTRNIAVKRGDTIVVHGLLAHGFGTLPASMYRATIVRIERPHPGDVARVFRDWFAAGVHKAIPEPEASLGLGYLTGQRSSLPAELDGQLRVVGLTHAVVASGYNLTILVTFARNSLAFASKYAATLLAAIMVLLFMAITGFSPSMTRAGLVSGIGLSTWYYGRTIHPLVLLIFAAAVTVGIQPAYAWGDIGWCLSFTAFAGVIIVAPLLRRYFWEEGHDPPMLPALIIETIAAQMATLPIILHVFGQLAIYALPANLLVLPLVPLTMVATFLAGVSGLAVPEVAPWVGWPAEALLHYMIWIIGRIAELPGAQKTVSIGWTELLLLYALLAGGCMYLWRKTGLDFRGKPSKKS